MNRRSKYFTLVLSGFVAFIVGISFFAASSYVSIDYIKRFVPSLASLYRQARFTARNIVWEIDQEIPNAGQTISAPLLELKLSRNDILHFDNLYAKYEKDKDGEQYYTEHNSWRKATLRYEGRKYDIKIKAQGALPDSHRKDQFISFTIKIINGKSIKGVTRFNLIIRERIQPQRLFNMLLAEKLGLIDQRLELVRVKINSWDEKLYFWEDRLDSKLMETRFNSSLKIFKGEIPGSPIADKALIFNLKDVKSGFDEKKAQNAFDIIFDEFSVAEKDREAIFDRYKKLNKTILLWDYQNFHTFFNLDYISSFEAARFLMGFWGHGAMKGNLYAPINFSDGKFYPLIVRDHLQSNINIWDNETIESKLEMFKGGQHRIPFLAMLNLNDIIRQEKYKKAYHFLLHDQQFIKEKQEIFEKHERLFYRGWLTQILRKTGGTAPSGAYDHNREVIKKYLEDSNPEVDFLLLDGKWIFRTIPHSMSAINLQQIEFKTKGHFSSNDNFKISLFKDGIDPKSRLASYNVALNIDHKNRFILEANTLYTSLSEKLEKEENNYYFVIEKIDGKMPTPEDLFFLFQNTVSQQDIKLSQYGVLSLTKEQQEKLPTSVNHQKPSKLKTFAQNYPDLNFQVINENHLKLNQGHYLLKNDLIIPNGISLTISEGTSISLGPGVSLIVRGGLSILGTMDNPVHIQAIENDMPFGTIGSLGNGNTNVQIEYLILKNGYEAWHDGVFFSGSLSLYHHKQVKILNSFISKGNADDGLNIKFVTDLEISKSKFSNNQADQVDLDYVLGTISSSYFHKTEGDSNGDGLDVSGSNVLIKENTFSGFSDKGISVGEESIVFLADNHLSNDRKGVAIKDKSIVYAGKNNFHDNELDIHLYRKKEIFGGGQLYIEKDTGEKLKLKADKRSAIHYWPTTEIEAIEKKILTMKDRKSAFVGYSNSLN